MKERKSYIVDTKLEELAAHTQKTCTFLMAFRERYIYIYIYICLFRAAPVAHGVSQVRGQIRTTATSLHHSQSNVRSEPHLQSVSQITATPDP